jgi:hypothetical protein
VRAKDGTLVNETAGQVWKFGVLAATRREKRKEIFLGVSSTIS